MMAMSEMGRMQARGFRTLARRGGVDLLFAGKQLPAVVEMAAPRELPKHLSAAGGVSYLRLFALREDLPEARGEWRGQFAGGGRTYRIAAVETDDPSDPVVAFICAVT
jgi:hypothetical protein